ncbi:MAG: peptidase M48, partial [Synechococcales cyanobacterium]
GGSPSFVNQLNIDAFLAQARTYETASQSQLAEVLQQAQNLNLSHPVPVLRAREIDRWADSQGYQTLIRGGGV